MDPGFLEDLACPACRRPLELRGGALACVACGRRYPVEDEIPDFLLDGALSSGERALISQLDKLASSYDRLVPRLYAAAGTTEPQVRDELLKRLRLRPGARVLMLGSGTGRDLRHLYRGAGPGGHVVGLDRSGAMLRVSQEKIRHQGTPVSLVRSGYVRLPFKDGRFDAVLQVGAVDAEVAAAALGEMLRVATPGGACVIMGEGSDPARRDEPHIRHWMANNPLHRNGAPVEALPGESAREVELHWVLQGLFYLLTFTKA